MGDPRFRSDLFRGTAQAYDQFRLPYPDALIDTLARCCPAAGTGTMLDLACGPGQLGFALRGRFREVWAVDLEPDMIALVHAKARAHAGLDSVRPVHAAAEDLIAPAGSFLLVTIGNAFHRMQREVVAANVFRWLRPGGWLALVWGGSPWDGEQAWQAALRAVMARWQDRVKARTGDRFPARSYQRALSDPPRPGDPPRHRVRDRARADLPARARVDARLHRGLSGQHVGTLGDGTGRARPGLRRGPAPYARTLVGSRRSAAGGAVRVRARDPPGGRGQRLTLEVPDGGDDPAVVAVGGWQPELGEDAGDVLLDHAAGDDQGFGDRGV